MGVSTVIPVHIEPHQHAAGVYRRLTDHDKAAEHFVPGVPVYLSDKPVASTTYRGRRVRRVSSVHKPGFRFVGVVHPLQRRVKQHLTHFRVAKIKIVSSGVTAAWSKLGLVFPACPGLHLRANDNGPIVGLDLGELHRGDVPVGGSPQAATLRRILLFPAQLWKL